VDSAPRPIVQPEREGEVSAGNPVQHYAEHAPAPLAITRGAEHTLVYANTAFRRLFDGAGDDALGRSITEALHGHEPSDLRETLDSVFRGDETIRIQGGGDDSRGMPSSSFSVWPVMRDDGSVDGLGIEFHDAAQKDRDPDFQREIAQRLLLGALHERTVSEDAEVARARASFLAQASRLLAESLDETSTLLTLTKLALPAFGGWCIVEIIAADGTIERRAIIHPDPEKQNLVRALEARWNPEPDDPFGAAAMVRSAETLVITEDIDTTLSAAGHDAASLDILRQLGIGSLLTVPLLARGVLLGAVTFVGSEHRRALSAADTALAEDLAARAAMALGSAHLYATALVLRKEAETANQTKTAFLGAMSHELRTPLNAIGGYVQLMDMGLRGPVTEAQHSDFARVTACQQHLLVLITEILNFVRVGSGGVSYKARDLNVRDAFTQAVELIEPLIARKGLVMHPIAAEPGIVAYADPEKVTQILVNLLSNAIKFTETGGSIALDATQKGDKVLLRVKDTGVGIPEDELSRVFDPFVQLKDGLAGREGGVGLGLAISRDLARAMKGDLTVTSTLGKGALFTLVLPRANTSPS